MIITERIKNGRVVIPDKIIDELRIDIISPKYKSGDRLVEEEISKRYGVSRGSVRTALKELESEGLIRFLPTGRKEVVGFSRKQACEIYDLRWLLENRAVEILLEDSSISYAPMLNVLEEIRSAIESQNDIDWFAMDIRFHQSLILSTGNRPLLLAWEANVNVMYALMQLYMVQSFEGYTTGFYDQHRELFQLIVARDVRVMPILREHILSARPCPD